MASAAVQQAVREIPRIPQVVTVILNGVLLLVLPHDKLTADQKAALEALIGPLP